jgi:hypothetical protein
VLNGVRAERVEVLEERRGQSGGRVREFLGGGLKDDISGGDP